MVRFPITEETTRLAVRPPCTTPVSPGERMVLATPHCGNSQRRLPPERESSDSAILENVQDMKICEASSAWNFTSNWHQDVGGVFSGRFRAVGILRRTAVVAFSVVLVAVKSVALVTAGVQPTRTAK